MWSVKTTRPLSTAKSRLASSVSFPSKMRMSRLAPSSTSVNFSNNLPSATSISTAPRMDPPILLAPGLCSSNMPNPRHRSANFSFVSHGGPGSAQRRPPMQPQGLSGTYGGVVVHEATWEERLDFDHTLSAFTLGWTRRKARRLVPNYTIWHWLERMNNIHDDTGQIYIVSSFSTHYHYTISDKQ